MRGSVGHDGWQHHLSLILCVIVPAYRRTSGAVVAVIHWHVNRSCDHWLPLSASLLLHINDAYVIHSLSISLFSRSSLVCHWRPAFSQLLWSAVSLHLISLPTYMSPFSGSSLDLYCCSTCSTASAPASKYRWLVLLRSVRLVVLVGWLCW